MSVAHEQEFQAPPPPAPPVPAKRRLRPTKLLFVAIGIFVVGLILAIGGFTKLLPSAIFPGLVFLLWALVMAGLSFIPRPQVDSKEEPLSTVQTLTGIFFEPTRVFRNLRVHPRWAAAFIVIIVLSLAYSYAFVRRVTPERIVNFNMDKLAESGFMPPEAVEPQRQIQLAEARNPISQVMQLFSSTAAIFLKYCAFAALILLGVLAFGGRMHFWQAFSAVLYVVLPWIVIQKILSLGLLYLKSPDDIHPILNQETLVQDNLAILVSPAEHPVLFVLLSVIGVLWIYWIWMLAKGIQNTGTKVSGSAAWGVTITLTVVMIVFGVVMASFFGSWMA
ncbi:MAG TPA: YIP1 family protein [Pyrinomonadaceae bacterium]|nr:YIP1 family protein [Pyrinomonadaceae bacterium]